MLEPGELGRRLPRRGQARVGWGRLGGTTPATCARLLGAAPELGAAPATSLAGAREPGEAKEASELGVGSESQGNSVKLGVWYSRAAADFHPKLLNLSAQFFPRLYCGKGQTRFCVGPGPKVTGLEQQGLNPLLSCLKVFGR